MLDNSPEIKSGGCFMSVTLLLYRDGTVEARVNDHRPDAQRRHGSRRWAARTTSQGLSALNDAVREVLAQVPRLL